MKHESLRIAPLILTVLTATAFAAAGAPLSPDENNAACLAQRFLAINGYLDVPAVNDRSRITLAMWDRISYEKAGVIDWDKLLADRRGRFSGRLFGITRNLGDYLLVYKFDLAMACLRIAGDFASVHLHESNCQPKPDTVKRVQEADLRCDGL